MFYNSRECKSIKIKNNIKMFSTQLCNSNILTKDRILKISVVTIVTIWSSGSMHKQMTLILYLVQNVPKVTMRYMIHSQSKKFARNFMKEQIGRNKTVCAYVLAFHNRCFEISKGSHELVLALLYVPESILL